MQSARHACRFLTFFFLFFGVGIPLSHGISPERAKPGHSFREPQKNATTLEKSLDSLSSVREQTVRDSLQLAARRESSRLQMSAEIQRIREMLEKSDSMVVRLRASPNQPALSQRQKNAALTKDINRMMQKKAALDARIDAGEKRTAGLSEQRKRLVSSSRSSENRYERLRTPYEETLKDAEAKLLLAKGECQLLRALREKLIIDRRVFQARDSLDRAIQLEAQRKRNAKKLVQKWEDVLDSLNAAQDALVRDYDGIRTRERTVKGLNLAQKIASVDSALRVAEKRVPGAKAPYERARASLQAFERQTPPPRIPSESRLNDLDSTIARAKRSLFALADQSDSLGMRIEETRNAIKRLSNARGSDAPDAGNRDLERALKTRKDLEDSLSVLRRDSIVRSDNNEKSLERIRSDLVSINSQLVIIRDDLAKLRAAGKPAPDRDTVSIPSNGQPVASDDHERLMRDAEHDLSALIEARDRSLRELDSTEIELRELRNMVKKQGKEIGRKKKELAQLEKKRNDEAAGERARSDAQSKGTIVAQQRLEEIYALISKDRLGPAVQLFRQLRPFLRAKLDPEAFQTLKLTLEQMGGVQQ